MDNGNVFPAGTVISYDIGVSQGTGIIRGIATVEQAVVGRAYIVELSEPVTIENNQYWFVSIFSVHIKPALHILDETK